MGAYVVPMSRWITLSETPSASSSVWGLVAARSSRNSIAMKDWAGSGRGDPNRDRRTVGRHEGVEYRHRIGDRRSSSRRHPDRAQDLDPLPLGQPAAEIRCVGYLRGRLDRSYRGVERYERVVVADVLFADARRAQ